MHKLTLKDLSTLSIYTQAVDSAKAQKAKAEEERRAAMAQAMREFGALTREQAAKLVAKRNPGTLTPVMGDRVQAPVGDNINDPAKLRSKRRVQAKPTWEEEANKRQAQYDEQQRQDYLNWLNKLARNERRLDSEFWATIAQLQDNAEIEASVEPETFAQVHSYQWGGIEGGAFGCIKADLDLTKAKPSNYQEIKAGTDTITSALEELGVALPKDVHNVTTYEEMGLDCVVAQALRNSK